MTPPRAPGAPGRRGGVGGAPFWVDVAVKVALVALLSLAVLFPHWHQFEGKAVGARLITYPLGALAVPIGWWLVYRRLRPASTAPYPYLADVLVTLPFAIDTAGNALNLFDTVSWWDDLMHFLLWMLLMGGVGTLFARARTIPPAALFGLVLGLGSTFAIGWELAEYLTFIRNSPELKTAYEDTLGDLLNGTCGGGVAAAVLSLRARGERRRARATTPT